MDTYKKRAKKLCVSLDLEEIVIEYNTGEHVTVPVGGLPLAISNEIYEYKRVISTFDKVLGLKMIITGEQLVDLVQEGQLIRSKISFNLQKLYSVNKVDWKPLFER